MRAEPDVQWVTLSDGFKFAQVPEELVYDPEITDGAVRVYAVLVRHGTDPSNCFPSYDRIGKLTGKSPRSIPRLILELEEAGWVERQHQRTPQGDLTSNGYHVFSSSQRATERGVRAPLRGPLRADERDTSAQDRAPKESQVKESQGERDLPAKAGERAPAVRPRDDVWDAMLAVCGLSGSTPTATERGKWNHAAKDLRDVGATPGEISRKARVYRRRWPNVSLTPMALAANWSQLDAAPEQQVSVPKAWGVLQRQREARVAQ